MAVLSNSDVLDEIRQGNIFIKDFDESLLGPNSYDVSIDTGSLYEITDRRTAEYIMNVQRSLVSLGIEVPHSMPSLADLGKRDARRKTTGNLRPGKVYIAPLAHQIETSGGIRRRIVPKSGRARDGLYGFLIGGSDMAIISYCENGIPTGTIGQAVFYEEGTESLSKEAMIIAAENRHIILPDSLKRDGHYDIRNSEMQDGIVHFTFNDDFKRYSGGALSGINDSSPMFSDGGKNGFNFVLGVTQERFGTGSGHILWMVGTQPYDHPNAPLCHANVVPQVHTVEVYLSPDEVSALRRTIKSGKNPYAISAIGYALRTPASLAYNGKYSNQNGAKPSIG